MLNLYLWSRNAHIDAESRRLAEATVARMVAEPPLANALASVVWYLYSLGPVYGDDGQRGAAHLPNDLSLIPI